MIELARRFRTAAEPVSVRPFGTGHVNDTFRVEDASGRAYILQRLNPQAFGHPGHVMENIVAVTRHLAGKARDPRDHLSLVPTRDGRLWTEDPDPVRPGRQGIGPAPGGAPRAEDPSPGRPGRQRAIWRMYDFVPGSIELPLPASEEEMRLTGEAFGRFLVDLADLDAACLHTTIPDFHDWPSYVAKLKRVVAEDPVGRAKAVGPQIERALAYEEFSHAFDDPDLMPLRVTHNDAKVGNVLFDAATRRPLCVVDLDTVQPGLAVNDFGDSIRSGATTAGEDEPDERQVHFSPERFRAFAEGYLATAGAVLTAAEAAHIPDACRLMT
ncbi:MAG: aminoglycoside phosphotransferase family protein, partial [Propionibacteriaceae bacterium]|nr:aminoglycoside phosphotransferase family protein [Propionibacteriaceae bacterium]